MDQKEVSVLEEYLEKSEKMQNRNLRKLLSSVKKITWSLKRKDLYGEFEKRYDHPMG